MITDQQKTLRKKTIHIIEKTSELRDQHETVNKNNEIASRLTQISTFDTPQRDEKLEEQS